MSRARHGRRRMQWKRYADRLAEINGDFNPVGASLKADVLCLDTRVKRQGPNSTSGSNRVAPS